jgi:hypothetical protein
VDERAAGCVGILHDDGQLGGVGGHARPLERRGDVVTVAGVDAGNDVAVGERRAAQRDGHGRLRYGNLIAVTATRGRCGGHHDVGSVRRISVVDGHQEQSDLKVSIQGR